MLLRYSKNTAEETSRLSEVTAAYVFVTNRLGNAVGTSVLVAFTDFLYQGNGLLPYVVTTACAIFYPLATLFFSFSLSAYRHSVVEASSWHGS